MGRGQWSERVPCMRDARSRAERAPSLRLLMPAAERSGAADTSRAMSQTRAAAVLTSWRKSQWLAGDASRCEQRFTFTLHGRGPRDTSLCRELCSTNVKGGAQLGDKVAQTRAMGSRIAQGDTAARERIAIASALHVGGPPGEKRRPP